MSYLGVRSLLAEHAARGAGAARRRRDGTPRHVLAAAADGADVVWVETPTNPTLDVADVRAIVAGAAAAGALQSSTRRSPHRCGSARSSTACRW